MKSGSRPAPPPTRPAFTFLVNAPQKCGFLPSIKSPNQGPVRGVRRADPVYIVLNVCVFRTPLPSFREKFDLYLYSTAGIKIPHAGLH